MDDFYIWQQIYLDWHDRDHDIEWLDPDRDVGNPITYKGGYIKTFISNKNGSLKNPLENFTPVGDSRFHPKENAFLDSIYGEYIDMIMEAIDGSIVGWHETGDGFYTHVDHKVLVKEDESPYFRKNSMNPHLRRR